MRLRFAEIVPFYCNAGDAFPRPAVTNPLYCPGGTVLTGITGAVPPFSNTVEQQSLQISGICGNPGATRVWASRGAA